MKVKDILREVEPQWLKNSRYDEIQPKVTIVLPTFCRGSSGHFEKAVESVLKQTYENWELIIIDDASVDGTYELIQFYMEMDKRVNCIHHTYNLGLPAISEYEAYVKSRGEYIAYIFDDNIWDKDHLFLSMKAMIKYNVKFTYGIARSFDEEHNYIDICFNLELLPMTNCIGNGAVVIHKSVIETVGLYDPHISVTRLCDWDLWKRISKLYHMLKIDYVVTEEYGASLKNSLGNTVDMNSWISLERMSEERDNALLPKNFEECDVTNYDNNSTEIFKQFINEFYKKYQSKKWYMASSNISYPILEQQTRNKKRILLVVPNFDATYSLAFEELNKYAIFRVVNFGSLNEKDIVYADIIIYVRQLIEAMKLLRKYERFNIPSYYYLDDNYREILRDLKHNSPMYHQIEKHVKLLDSNEMLKFNGIIFSTKNLKDYFENKMLHNNITILPPCKDCWSDISKLETNKCIKIAFMGGEFREENFISKVYPSIIKLAENIQVRLICPATLSEKILKTYKIQNNISLVEIERMTAYNQMMVQYKEHGINVLIHCGDEIKNNQYKTKNALINAVDLGAVLITSNIEPYRNEQFIITSDDSKDNWYNCLKKVCEDEVFYNEQLKKQKQFVQKNYSQKVVSKIFEDIIKEVKEISIPAILNRYDKVIEQGVERKLLIQQELNFIDRLLSFSNLIKRKNDFYLKDDLKEFSKFGVIFSSEDNILDGRITARIYDKNNYLLAQSSLEIKDIEYRQISYFNFGSNIKVSSKFKVSFETEYSLESRGCIGIYESKAKRNILYRVLKKITGIKLPIVNLLYYDLQ